MRIAICDDERTQILLTAEYIQSWAAAHKVPVELFEFLNGESFLSQWSDSVVFDMAFLDIQMGGMSGIQLAEKIRRVDDQLILVFITGLQEYVFRGYEVEALRYLLKPVKEQDCWRCLEQAYQRVSKRHRDTFIIHTEGMILKFFYEDIYYFEAFSHYVEAHTTKGVFRYKKKMCELERELSPHQFIRCHRSCIVNLMYINILEKTALQLDDGTSLPISGDRRHIVNEAFLRYHRNG